MLNNIAYWARHTLDARDIAALKIVKAGFTPRVFRFEVAFLISLGCIFHDVENDTLKVTDKGEDALRFFSSEGEHDHQKAS